MILEANFAGCVQVFLAALVTAVSTGLGALPFLFWKKGFAIYYPNAIASGMMLACAAILIVEGCVDEQGLLLVALGTFAGIILVVVSKEALEGQEEERKEVQHAQESARVGYEGRKSGRGTAAGTAEDAADTDSVTQATRYPTRQRKAVSTTTDDTGSSVTMTITTAAADVAPIAVSKSRGKRGRKSEESLLVATAAAVVTASSAGASAMADEEAVGFAQFYGASGKKTLLLVLVMFVHSFAEGISIGVGWGRSHNLGTLVTSSLALHNVPEGIAISVVMIGKGSSVWEACLWSIFSSLPQPVMAVPAFLFVKSFEVLLPVGMGFAAGAMIWVVVSELLPEARADGPAWKVYPLAFVCFAVMLRIGLEDHMDKMHLFGQDVVKVAEYLVSSPATAGNTTIKV